jgi:multiple sugar transport system substrate-binding protein
MWFGGEIFDQRTEKFTLTDPKVVAAYDWIAGYSRRMGANATQQFRGGLGNFDSPQNGFLAGYVVMEQQGPWMANFIEHLQPSLQHLLWSHDVEMTKPLAERKKNYAWAAAPFPSAVPGMKDVTLAAFDALVIPRAAKHKREAFEFIAYVNRQDVMERICTMHCKNSPLRNVSESFLHNHPNPYIDVFEELASSPNARSVPQIPIWQEVSDELTALSQQMTLLQGDAQSSLQAIQDRLQVSYDKFAAHQRALANASK